MNVLAQRTARLMGAAAPVAAALLVAVVATPSAVAAPERLGELTFYPGKGSDIAPMYLITSGPCPAAATNTVARAYGKGFPAEGQVVVPNGTANLSRTDRFLLPFQDTMRGFASVYGITLSGPYRVVLTCQNRLGDKQFGTFEGVVTFTSPTTYRAKETLLDLPGPDEAAPSAGAAPGASSSARPTAGASRPGAPSPGAATPGAAAAPGATGGSAAPAPASTAAPEPGLPVDGGDTNAAAADPVVSRVVDGGPGRWLLLALGALLVLLGLGWYLRGRSSRDDTPTPPPAREGVAPGDAPTPDAHAHDLASTSTESS